MPVAGECPSGLVGDAVVVVAHECAGFFVGFAAAGPFGDVVGVAPGGANGAAWPAAVLVACDEGEEQVLGDEACFVAEVEDG